MRSASGHLCGFCRRPINRDRDGGFCEGCRNPMHYDCAKPGAAAGRTVCSVCGINLAAVATGRADRGPGVYTDYAQVPWYRQSWANNLFVALSFFGCIPLALWTCINLLTGDVYFPTRGPDGTLETWGIINKIWAFCFLIGWTVFLAVMLIREVAGLR
jgi:hypothetical protein